MQVQLFNRSTQLWVSAEIVSAMDCHIQHTFESWVNSFRRRDRVQNHGEDTWMCNANASHLELLIHRDDLQSFAVVLDDQVIGVLFLQGKTQPSRLECHKHLIYVVYVATAPWNRPDKNGPGQLRGVGTALMTWAVQFSRQAGCEGQLGLHSLRSSDAFYLRLGFCCLGSDAAHFGMSYFESREST